MYLAGQVEKAAPHLRAYLGLEKDAYRAWRARVWLDRMAFELDPKPLAKPPPGQQVPSFAGLEKRD